MEGFNGAADKGLVADTVGEPCWEVTVGFVAADMSKTGGKECWD